MYIKGNQGIIWIEEENAMYELENIYRNMLIQSGRYED